MPSFSSSSSSCSSSSCVTGLVTGEVETVRETKKFEIGQTVYLECYFRNMESELEDPTGPAWKIFNNKSEIIASGVPLKKSTGVYYFFWTPDAVGDYLTLFQGSLTGYSVVFRRKIKIVETKVAGQFSSSCSSSCSSSSSFSSSCSSSSSFSSSSYSSSSKSLSSSCSSSSGT